MRRSIGLRSAAVVRVLGVAPLLIVAVEAHAQEPVLTVPPIEVRVPRTPLDPSRLPYALSSRDVWTVPPLRPAASLEEAFRTVPGVQVDNRFNLALGERLSVRGFGSRSAFGVRGIKVLLDGLPATLPDGQTQLTHIDPATVGALRVLRGPAAALWGNAAGGVIELRSVAPPEEGSVGELRLDAGGSGLRRVLARAAGGGGGNSFGIHVSEHRWGGYREHSDAEVRRASFLIERRAAGTLRLRSTFVEYDARNPGALTADQRREDPGQAQAVNQARGTGERGRQFQAGIVWDAETPLAGIEAALHGSVRAVDNPIPIRIVDLSRRSGGVRVIARRAAGRVAWVAGAELDAQRDDRRNYENREGERGTTTLSQVETVIGSGAFVSAGFAIGPRLAVSGAVRHDRMIYRADDRLVGPGEPDDSGDRALGATSPTAGLSLDVGRGWLLYGNGATAFEAPTTTELANRPDGAGGLNPALEPQRTFALEIGARRAGGRRWLEAAAYRARIEDALIPFELPDSPGRAFYRNAGAAVHRGIELAGGLAGSHGSATLSYAWTDARFRRYATEAGDHGGNRVPGVADHRVDLSLQGSASRLFAGLDIRAASSIPVDDANSAWTEPYALLDLAVGIRGAPGSPDWSLTLGVTNATGVEYDASVVVNAAGGRFFEPGPPRTAYVVLRLAPPLEAGAAEGANRTQVRWRTDLLADSE